MLLAKAFVFAITAALAGMVVSLLWSSIPQVDHCTSLLSNGPWPPVQANQSVDLLSMPAECMLHQYQQIHVAQCLSNHRLIFLGDSTARFLFWAAASKAEERRAQEQQYATETHTNITFKVDCGSSEEILFIWDPYLNETQSFASLSEYLSPTSPCTFVVGAGLWHSKHLGSNFSNQFAVDLSGKMQNALLPSKLAQDGTSEYAHQSHDGHEWNVIMLPLALPKGHYRGMNRVGDLTEKRVFDLNREMALYHEYGGSSGRFYILKSYQSIIAGNSAAYAGDTVHPQAHIISSSIDIILNYICNFNVRWSHDRSFAYCCSDGRNPNPIQWCMVLSISWLAGLLLHTIVDRSRYRFSRCLRGSPFTCPNETVVFITGSCFAILFCFWADRTALLTKTDKIVSQKYFVWLTGIFLFLGISTPRFHKRSLAKSAMDSVITSPHISILSRPQTEEWKGWMQIVILLYHYFGMSRVLWVYQFIRVLVASYLFLAGYGHTMYLLQVRQLSLHRMATVLLRTNILAILLAFVMGTDYGFYYFPAQASTWFIITFLTIQLPPTAELDRKRLVRRIAVSTIIIQITIRMHLSVPRLCPQCTWLNFPLVQVNLREFMFRLGLDSFIVYVGMLAAIFSNDSQRSESLLITVLPTHTSDKTKLSTWKIIMPALCIILAYVAMCSRFHNKFEYNKWHPFVSPAPVLAYVVIRNSIRPLVHSHSEFFAWFGRMSLETYVLQYHIWLAADAEGTLRGCGFRLLRTAFPNLAFWLDNGATWKYWFEFVMVTANFVLLSYMTSKGTSMLVAKFIGPESLFVQRALNDGLPHAESNLFSLVDLRTKLILSGLALSGLNLVWHSVETE